MNTNLFRPGVAIPLDILPNATLEEVVNSACDLADEMSTFVKFTFEGIEMIVGFHHQPEEVMKEWRKRKEIQGYIEKEPINRVI